MLKTTETGVQVQTEVAPTNVLRNKKSAGVERQKILKSISKQQIPVSESKETLKQAVSPKSPIGQMPNSYL